MADLEGRVATDEFTRILIAIIRRCIKDRQKQDVLIELIVNERGYLELAEEMGIKVNYLHQLKHRAQEELRRCDAFVAFWNDRL